MIAWRSVALLTLLQVAGALAPSPAETLPAPGAVDSRVRTVNYDPQQVYRLVGYVGYQLEFEFAAGESFVGLAAGDVKGLSFESEANHLFLKPTAAGVLTNITVLTTRHHYRVDYAVAAGRPDPARGDVTYALHFNYPEEQLRNGPVGEQARIAETLRTPALPVNWDYWYCGPASIRPDQAYDDGYQTHLRFAKASELPALFLRNEDGSESLTNFTVTEQEIVIHRVVRQMILRRGRLVGCLVNKSFAGTQERAAGGTLSPAVLRDTRGPSGDEREGESP